jgi:hypothetical protein
MMRFGSSHNQFIKSQVSGMWSRLTSEPSTFFFLSFQHFRTMARCAKRMTERDQQAGVVQTPKFSC